jgi:hypothetical protein
MIVRIAVPIVILAVLFLSLPFALCLFVLSTLLAVRPRGDPDDARLFLFRAAGSTLLRSPPR